MNRWCLLCLFVLQQVAIIALFMRQDRHSPALPNQNDALRVASEPLKVQSFLPVPQAKASGVAVMLVTDSPGWLQRRYPMLLANALANLPPDWRIQFIAKNSSGAQRGIRSFGRTLEWNKGRVTVTWMPDAIGKLRRIQITSTPWFWDSLEGERVLFLSAGSAICGSSAHGVEDFKAYSLVGALWTPRRVERPGDTRTSLLVDRQIAMQVVRARNTPYLGPPEGDGQWWHDDIRNLVPLDKQAPRTVQSSFALGRDPLMGDGIPFIVSGTMQFIAENRSAMVERCPEIKMIFPSLHDPNCFGAKSTLDKEKCYASLCVTSPPGPGC